MAAVRWLLAAALVLAVMPQVGHGAQQLRRDVAVAAPRQAGPAQPPAGRSPEMRIAAVVNDEVVSVFDLVSRIRILLLSSNITDTPEARQQMVPQVLRALIDERLELEEAKRESVTATDAEIKRALDQIEKQNNMKPGQLNEFLKARGIDRSSLIDQLTASIEWAKLVRRKAAQTIDIGDDEIDAAMKRVKANAKEPESRVAEIFLTVDNPAQDGDVRGLAERLTKQMRQGARFSAIARQFSQSATAAVGGDMGWLRPDQLPADLSKEVSQLKVGELSPPIRAAGGYYLLLVVDRRNGPTDEADETYDIVQVVFALPPKASEATRRMAIAEADRVRGAAKDCPTLLQLGHQKAPQLSSEGKLRESEISPLMRSVVDRLAIGQVSEPIVQKNGVGVIMVCSKSKEGGQVTRVAVAEQLLRERLDTVARQYLRDLRRNAYVDVRM
jgi:peptidyl-prolyl cis-trans isomerase SurA